MLSPEPSPAPDPSAPVRLLRQGDRLLAARGDAKPETARLLIMRPLSAPGGPFSLLGTGDREIASLPSLDVLDVDSRRLAEEELDRNYGLPRITRINRAWILERHFYFDTETDRGARTFVVRSIGQDISRHDGGMIIRDCAGCRYRIENVAALDASSRQQLEQVLP